MLKFRAMNILLAIVVAFTILPTLPVYAEPSNDVDEVKQTLNQALEYKYNGYVSSDPDEAKKALKSLHATEKSFKDVEDEIDRERSASLQARLKYTKHSTKLDIGAVEINEGVANVEATETTFFDITTFGGPTDTAFIKNHVYELQKIGNKWVISKDTEIGGIRPVEPEPGVKPIPPFAKTMKLNPDNKMTIPKLDKGYKIASTNYNGNAAASYAYTFALDRNYSYRYFPLDCTNFVSQAVKYGGWWDVSGNKWSSQAWWYNWYTQTYTWTSADYWFWFTATRPRAYLVSYPSDLHKGDVVQMDYNCDGTMDHSMVVTDKDYSGTIYLSYHTSNTRNRSIYSIMQDYPNANYYGWRMYSTVY